MVGIFEKICPTGTRGVRIHTSFKHTNLIRPGPSCVSGRGSREPVGHSDAIKPYKPVQSLEAGTKPPMGRGTLSRVPLPNPRGELIEREKKRSPRPGLGLPINAGTFRSGVGWGGGSASLRCDAWRIGVSAQQYEYDIAGTHEVMRADKRRTG